MAGLVSRVCPIYHRAQWTVTGWRESLTIYEGQLRCDSIFRMLLATIILNQ